VSPFRELGGLRLMKYRLGCYLLDVRGTGASGVELIGYGGYKFVGYVSSLSVLNIAKH
jgi:hypothetical protein